MNYKRIFKLAVLMVVLLYAVNITAVIIAILNLVLLIRDIIQFNFTDVLLSVVFIIALVHALKAWTNAALEFLQGISNLEKK